jgi:recombination associated protein RdgC
MSLRRGSIAFAQFAFTKDVPKDSKKWILSALKKGAFEPIDIKSDEERSSGFVELEFSERTEFAVNSVFHSNYALFAFRVDSLKVPSAKVRRSLFEWKQAFENRESRSPSRQESNDQKEQIKKTLRAQTQVNSKTFDVSIHLEEKRILVWATSRSVIDDLHGLLLQYLEVDLKPRVPAAFVSADELDALLPTPELFEVQS